MEQVEATEEERAFERSEQLLKYFDDNIKWYHGASQHARRMHRGLGCMCLVLAIAIPLITSASSASYIKLIPEIDKELIVGLAVFLGFILAAGEALRRFFSFERNWITFYTSWIALKHQRSIYLDKQARVQFASEEWWGNLDQARAAINDLIAKETGSFFENLKAVGDTPKGA